ncbi:MAG TPA: oligosaccharide flippase family protein, partial [Nitrosomonas sp.]|nr:oligosaccharide flippase family protein [Nitrosomonas sp.]
MLKRIKSELNQAKTDKHMIEVARGTILAFILKVIGAGLAFAFNVAIARLLGAEGAGLFFLALSVTAVGSVLGRVGLDNTLLRFIATHTAKGEISLVKGVYSLGMRLAITVSCALSLLGFLLSPWIAIEIFNKPALTESLQWMSLA